MNAVATPDTSRLFKPWKDPISGVTSYLLEARVAPLQQSFYFTNPSWTVDGETFWFYAAFPPSGSHNRGRCLARIDFRDETVHLHPETQFLDASPCIDTHTGEAFWCREREIWRRPADSVSEPVLVNQFPSSLSPARHVWRLATHLTFRSDNKSLNIDAEIGREWFIGEAPLDGRPMEIWKKFDRCYNHGQFSPTDPNLQLIAQDYANDPLVGAAYSKDGDGAAATDSGRELGISQRMWLLSKGGQIIPVYPGGGSNRQGHEWWSADGKRVWYMHYGQGVEYVDLKNGLPISVWSLPKGSHAHVNGDESLVVADCLPNADPKDRSVQFLNRTTGRSVCLVTHLPALPEVLMRYHIDPHPQFAPGDRWVVYTTTVRGRVDVAFAKVSDLMTVTS